MKKVNTPSVFIVILAIFAISVTVLTVSYITTSFDISKNHNRLTSNANTFKGDRSPKLSQKTSECVAQDDKTLSVGGLERYDVPRLPSAIRADFAHIGYSQYLTWQKEKDVFNYYVSKLAQQCWNLLSLQPHEALWRKEDSSLRIVFLENLLGGRSRVDYQISGGSVLGVSYGVAATSADPTPPVISSISGTTNLGVTTVSWVTDEPADSRVDHGSTPSYGYVNSSSSFTTNHSLTLGVGLRYDYTYYYRITSKDQNGNVALSDPQTIFVPLPPIPCVDSDNGANLGQKGTATGIYGGAVVGYHKIYGQEPNPSTPKDTSNNYSTYIDYCANTTQLNEGYCESGQIQAIGMQCPNGCKDGVCITASDSPPAISISVKSTNALHPDTIYAGLGAEISVTIQDDKGISSGSFTVPGVRTQYNPAEALVDQCSDGNRTCSRLKYGIVPDKPGLYTITVTATDTGAQTATQTLTFTAVGCSSASECGGTYFPSSGSNFCDTATSLKVMKYQIVAECISGSCYEKSEPGVVQDCSLTGQICGTSGWQAQCIAGSAPTACPINTPVTAQCICGGGGVISGGYCCLAGTNPYNYPAGPCPSCSGPYVQDSGTYSCNLTLCKNGCIYDSKGCPNGCISSTGGSTTPSQSQCPEGQYLCNNSCVANTISCNGITPPTSPSPSPPLQITPDCGACRVYQDGRCVEAPTGTRDKSCGPNASCNGNGGCMTVTPSPGPSPALLTATPIPEKIKIDDSRFNAIKTGLRDWENAAAKIEKQSKQIERRIRAKNCKVNLPPEIKSIEKARQIIAKIKSAKTPDEIENLISEMQDVSDAFTELGNVLGRLVGLCDTIKRAESDIKIITRNYKKIASSLKKYPNIEELANELKALVDTMTQTLQNTRELAKTDPASALDAVETFYDSIEEVWTLISQINMIQDLPKGIKQIQDEIKRVEKIIAAMKKAPEYDTALMNELTELIAELKENLAEAQTLSKQKPINKEALGDAIRTLWESFEELENKLSEQGQGLYRKKILSKEETKLAPPPGWDFKQGS